MSKDEIIVYCKHNKMDKRIDGSTGVSACDYIYGMLNNDHVNMKLPKEYEFEEFMTSSDIEVIHCSQSYEGENLLTEEILKELRHIEKEDILSHGFEFIFRGKQGLLRSCNTMNFY